MYLLIINLFRIITNAVEGLTCLLHQFFNSKIKATRRYSFLQCSATHGTAFIALFKICQVSVASVNVLSMEHRWSNTDKIKWKCREKNLSHIHFVHHKSHTDWLGIKPATLIYDMGD